MHQTTTTTGFSIRIHHVRISVGISTHHTLFSADFPPRTFLHAHLLSTDFMLMLGLIKILSTNDLPVFCSNALMDDTIRFCVHKPILDVNLVHSLVLEVREGDFRSKLKEASMGLLHLIFGNECIIFAFIKVIVVELIKEDFHLGEFTLGSVKGADVSEKVCFEADLRTTPAAGRPLLTIQSFMAQAEQPSSSSIEAHDLSEAQGKDDYEGDGFGVMKYKLLRGKGEGGKSSANPFTTLGSGALVAAFLLLLSCCLCCLRYRRRRYAQSKRPSRGNYAALGRHDFFNGTFSDDVSYGKDSDDDISIESYGSDDGGHQTNLEMGGFHEFDANGGLTLEEING
eukprot:scaffold3393_cov200-Skeletonema_dohrnii-CCMP3373.AAC.1